MAVALQRSFFAEDSWAVWKPPQEFPRLEGIIALDGEFKDPLFKSHGSSWFTKDQGFMTGIAVAGPDWQSYFPTRHASGNLDENSVLRWLRRELLNPNLTVIMYNSLYDYGWLKYRYGIEIKGRIFDPITAVPLIDETRFNNSLDSVVRDYLPGHSKDLKSLKDAGRQMKVKDVKSIMDELPASFIGPYAEMDARVTWDLHAPLIKILNDNNLNQIFDLETRLVQVLLAMRSKGVRVDLERAHRLRKVFIDKHDAAIQKIHQISGKWIEVNNARQIAEMLDKLEIPYGKTDKSGEPSITADLLKGMNHEVGMLLLSARKYMNACNTFIDGHILGHQIDGKIHGQFSPLRKDESEGGGGAVTGRFSASNPNLQNLPGRDDKDELKDEIGLAIRGCFLPWEGEEWAAVDYASQEPRLAVHFANIAHIRGVELFVKAYRENPHLDFHSKGAEFTGLPRKNAKNITLGKMYRMGGAKLCRSLGLPTIEVTGRNGKIYEVAGPEGQKIIDQYDKYMPWVRGLSDMCENRATIRGWIRTLLHRLRHFQPIHSRGAFPYKALNCLIQGSAADMTKKAMVDLYEQEGVVPLVTVHDELGLSIPDRIVGAKYMLVMTNSVELSIPMAADMEIGPNWGESKAA